MTGQGGPFPLVELLLWDTEFWGVRAARIRAATTLELSQGLVECAERGVRWASLLVPVADPHLVGAAVRAGFEVVDIRVTMSTTLHEGVEPSEACLVAPDELDQALLLVQDAFRTSRFYLDTHLDRVRCSEFYRTWVRNSFSGKMADAIVASRHGGTLDAFVTVRREVDRTASLPLVAVRSDRRGVGVGARVVSDALNWLRSHGSSKATVVTQLANIAAIRLYESVGFSISESGVWLHHWLDPDGSS